MYPQIGNKNMSFYEQTPTINDFSCNNIYDLVGFNCNKNEIVLNQFEDFIQTDENLN
jgi:hypothetical protein